MMWRFALSELLSQGCSLIPLAPTPTPRELRSLCCSELQGEHQPTSLLKPFLHPKLEAVVGKGD